MDWLLGKIGIGQAQNRGCFVIDMEWLLDKWKGEVQNHGCQWFDFDKPNNKFIYGAVACDKKLQLVAQSVFGGDAVVVQEIDAGVRYNARFTGVVTNEVVAVVSDGFFQFYLFSLSHKSVEIYDVVRLESFVSGAFGRGVLIDRGLFHSSHIGFFTMLYCEMSGQFMYRFVFDEVKKTCQPELVTKFPAFVSYSTPLRRYTGNDSNFFVFKEGGDLLHVYDIQKNSWSKRTLCNAPLYLTRGGSMKYGRSLKGVTTTKEGKSIAIFFKAKMYTLRELVGDSWELRSLGGNFETVPGHRFCSAPLCTGNGIYIDGGKKSVIIVQQSVSLSDLVVKKIIGFWNHDMPCSFQSFLNALKLPPLTTRVYFGLTSK